MKACRFISTKWIERKFSYCPTRIVVSKILGVFYEVRIKLCCSIRLPNIKELEEPLPVTTR